MARELIPSLTPLSPLEYPVTSCILKSDIKPGCNPQVIDLTSENTSSRMSNQPLRHLPPYPTHHHSSAFHRVNHPAGHLAENHSNPSGHGCPFLHHASTQRQPQHHRTPNRLYHPPANNAFCPLNMGSTIPLQHHPPHPGPPVLIDVDQVPDHVRTVPVTSLPNSVLVTGVPVAAPSYVQPHQPPIDVDPRDSDLNTHHHHHYHHHHHHHHFVQHPYQVSQPQAYQPYPTPGPVHYRHHRRWYQNNPHIPGWSSRRSHTAMSHPPPLNSGIQPYPDLLYHLISVMSMRPIPTQPPPPAWEEEPYQHENYETLLNLAEQMGDVKPKGLSRVEIEQLPTYRVMAGSKNDEEKRCVVCLVDFEEKQLVRVLPCLHEYHTRCIDKWLKSNRSCPICRAEVTVNSE